MSASKDEKIQKIIGEIEKHLKELKKLCKVDAVPSTDLKKLETMNKSVNAMVEKSLQKMEDVDAKPAFSSAKVLPFGMRSVRKTVKKSAKKSAKKLNSYAAFVKKHMKDKEISALPVTERMSVIADMWHSRK